MKAPVRLTSITFCQAARLYSRNGADHAGIVYVDVEPAELR